MKIHDLKQLMDRYGDLKISEIIDLKNKPFACPKCKGLGAMFVSYNTYPQGLLHSEWVQDIKHKEVKCEVCDGEGYTAKELKPKTRTRTEIIGYE